MPQSPESAPPALAGAEQLLAQLIRSPFGVEAALQSAPELEQRLADLIHGDAERPAALRLQVYATAYFARLEEALSGDFGALRAVLGEGWFHDLCKLYVLQFPPRHPSLRYCGDRLVDFLRDAPGAEPLRARFAWASALAQLEWAVVSAFDAENAELLQVQDLAALAAERWAELELRAHPSLELLELGWPVIRLRRAFEAEAAPALDELAPRRELVLVWRRGEQVEYRELEPAEADALGAVLRGAPFGEICERAAAFTGEEAAPAQAAAWLARWLQDGCIRRGSPE